MTTRFNLTPPIKPQQYHSLNAKMEVLRQLYQTNMTLIKIAKNLNVSRASIYQFIKSFNLPPPQRWAKYRFTIKGYDKELLQMRQSGMTLKQIGDIFGIQDNTVSHHLKKLGSAYA